MIYSNREKTDLINIDMDISFNRNAKAQLNIASADSLPLEDQSVDLIVTSPPYWNKRDYGFDGQIGCEKTPELYVESLRRCLVEWKRVLRDAGSVFLNIGDSYHNKCLINIPGMVEAAAIGDGWVCRNRIIWAKPTGMPEPAKDRLANRYEYIIHLTKKKKYFYDTQGYCELLGVNATPGDVWTFAPDRSMSSHLAPFPKELVRRAITLACPTAFCTKCGKPVERVLRRTAELDPARPQAKRAMELAREKGLSPEHIRAIQSFGISDVGKATRFQTGTGRSSDQVVKLAAEAKAALSGYFREFTFAKWETAGWQACKHNSLTRGVVLDPFAGTGTTLRVALEMGRDSFGTDLNPIIPEDLVSQISIVE
ncbi:MAG: DNA methyltransferase [Slackia sp.]|uniref:DNA-methyltransferase n=1 Tax=uncultured Slackia sp. TaxID=665903 RepID=UPI002803FD07|nr:DNA methyltransferase [uncultured Slackia sp.]MDU6012109.1 DNA methyltransferase [Slackia sp.]